MKTSPNGHPPLDRLSSLDNFGHSLKTISYLYRPVCPEQVADLFALARRQGIGIAFRGAGKSYGDASLNAGGIVVDLRRMNRILEWNPETGVIRVEPGITIQQLWQHTLEDGWWPPVVPGTMHPTLGGCLASNVHGKNNWQTGTIGEHVLEFSALLPSGEEVVCTPEDDLFYSLIGGLGLLGMFTSITLQLKRVHSGLLRVHAWAEPNLERMLAATDQGKEAHDYLVGWLDCMAGGTKLGRGQMHTADYLEEGEDPQPARSLQVDFQTLPDTFFGLVPKSMLYRFMRPFMNNPGVRWTNAVKSLANRTIGHHKHFLQTHAAFNFLLDYVPNWELSYGGRGMLQYQCFVPAENAQDVFTEVIRLGLARGVPNYLGVLKRHRPDRFLLSHAVDGFSFAQDYRVTRRNRELLRGLLADLDRLVLEAGGRFYFAKDSMLTREVAARFLGEATLEKFQELKKKCDPQGILESDLYRRCFLAG